MEIMLAYSLVLANTGLKMRVVPPFSSYGIPLSDLMIFKQTDTLITSKAD